MFRASFLHRFPLCGMRCDGRLHSDDSICARDGNAIVGNVVDHIVPHRGDEFLFLSDDNVQTLCKACHDRKTAKEINMRRKQQRERGTSSSDAPRAPHDTVEASPVVIDVPKNGPIKDISSHDEAKRRAIVANSMQNVLGRVRSR